MSTIKIHNLIKSDEKYDLTIFSAEGVHRIEKNIIEKDGKPYVKCLIRNKDIQIGRASCRERV